MTPFVQVMAAAVGTYFVRVSFIAFGERLRTIPPRGEIALSMIPPAALSAIASTSLLLGNDGGLRGLDEWHVAAAIAAVVAWKTKSVLWCLVVAMGLVWILA